MTLQLKQSTQPFCFFKKNQTLNGKLSILLLSKREGRTDKCLARAGVLLEE
jgi:hypothetical protein